jgi:hypothetical protein
MHKIAYLEEQSTQKIQAAEEARKLERKMERTQSFHSQVDTSESHDVREPGSPRSPGTAGTFGTRQMTAFSGISVLSSESNMNLRNYATGASWMQGNRGWLTESVPAPNRLLLHSLRDSYRSGVERSFLCDRQAQLHQRDCDVVEVIALLSLRAQTQALNHTHHLLSLSIETSVPSVSPSLLPN